MAATNKIILSVSMFLMFIALTQAQAQEILSIDTLFGKYGKTKGATMLNLAKDVLGDNSRVVRYKCLIINGNNETLPLNDIAENAEDAMKKDYNRKQELGNRNVIFESTVDGRLQTVYYLLSRESDSPFYEYILYSNNNRKITLIYIKGRFPEKQLDYELSQLKNLFIKIKK
jgi:hypothetical protein